MSRRGRPGQALVIMVIAVLAIVAGMGLIIDGGNAWANQRMTQAGNDAACRSRHGRPHRIMRASRIPGGWDAEVASHVASTAAANAIEVHGRVLHRHLRHAAPPRRHQGRRNR